MLSSIQPRLIVHGGAWNIPEAYLDAHLNGVYEAVRQAYPALETGGSALDVVETAVRVLEADPTFDAGRGAFLNSVGEIELDAIIMDGRDLSFGAVGAVRNLLHPVSLARMVMEETEHCFLVGTGAEAFARLQGVKILPPEDLLTERELAFYHEIRHNPTFKTHHPFEDQPHDTVGAVALDRQGRLAVATSTGGTARKMPGRLGDCPIVGAGAYADNALGGVSATGWGESIMKVLLSKTVCDLFEHHPANEAAALGISILQNKVQGLGGVIGINRAGHYAYAFNTPKMAMAFAEEDGRIVVGIQGELFAR